MTKESFEAVLCFEIGIELPKRWNESESRNNLLNRFFAARTLVHARIYKYRILLLSDFLCFCYRQRIQRLWRMKVSAS